MTLINDAYFAGNPDPNSSYEAAFEDDAGGPDGVPLYRFGMVGYGWAGGIVGCGGPAMTRLLGPYSTFAGVHGTARDFTGVAGTSVNGVGVYGQVEDVFKDKVPIPINIHAGVLGTALTQPGVVGVSDNMPGVEGDSFLGNGVAGASDTQDGVFGMSGPAGPQAPKTSNIAGVVGSSDRQHGVIGTSNASVGVIGFSNTIGVLGYTTTPGALAGQFIGDVSITGNLTVGGSFNLKGCAVPFPDGT